MTTEAVKNITILKRHLSSLETGSANPPHAEIKTMHQNKNNLERYFHYYIGDGQTDEYHAVIQFMELALGALEKYCDRHPLS
jgi:hypothetical protein